MQHLQTISNCISQIQLSDFSNTDIMMTSKVIRTLEKKGYIEKNKHPLDTRAYSLNLTKEGDELVQKTAQYIKEFDLNYFGPLSTQMESFSESLRILKESK